jgi:hypothetical protein
MVRAGAVGVGARAIGPGWPMGEVFLVMGSDMSKKFVVMPP